MAMDGKRWLQRTTAVSGLLLIGAASGCVHWGFGEPPTAPPTLSAKSVGPGPQPINGVVPASLPPPDVFQERLTVLLEELAAANDAKKALIGRMHNLERELMERDQSLRLAQAEIGAAAAEMERARAEQQRQQQEILKLREKIKQLEKENKEVLETVIKLLEQADRPRVPASVPGQDR